MRIVERVRVEAPRAQVWELVSDPRRWPEFMDGLVVSEVLSEQVTGCGARWAIRFQVGAAALGGTVEVVEFHEPADLAWNGVTGISMRGRWRLRERTPGRTDVELRLAYQAPGGFVAAFADRLAAAVVQRRLRNSLRALREVLRPQAPGPAPG